MESTETSFNQQTLLFGGVLRKVKKTGDICSGGPSGVFRQNSDLEKSQRSGALSSCARAARESIGGIGNLISRKMASAGIPPTGPWPNKKNDYEVGEVIGAGATAIVHFAYCKPREEKCAIKKICLEKWNTNMDELLKEIQAMSNCNHENIVTYYTSFVVKDELWLVLKLLEGGSLLDIIKHKLKNEDCRNGVFDENVIATILHETLKGLEYFHKNGQIHRDIKAGNILLSIDGNVQIGDFGVSAWLATGRDLSKPIARNTFVGTPCWMAPEVMEQDHGYDFKADIWSFGITAIELATGRAPYHNYPPMKVLMLTLQNEPPTLDYGAETKDQYKAFGKSFRKMINDCLQKDPKKRPTASELLQHQFFKKAKDRRFLSQYIASAYSNPVNHKVNRHIGIMPSENNSSMNIEWSLSDDEDNDVNDNQMYINSNNVCVDNHITANTLGEAQNNLEASKCNEKNTSSSLSFVLRIRNKNRQLDDIRFEFHAGKDKPSGIASELESAGLIDSLDVDIITENLNSLMSDSFSGVSSSTKTFPLNSPSPFASFNSKALLGYAQLSMEQ